jgi:type I restriction enzyme S subunit
MAQFACVRSGAVFIRTQDINKDRLDLTDVARVALPEKVEGKRSRVEPGDLLVTITGANVGKVAVVPEDIPEAYVSQSVGLMRLKDKRWAPYLHYYLQSDYTGRKHLTNLVYGIGRPVLSLQNLRDVPVALPALTEQRLIVAEIEKQFTRLDAGIAALRRTQTNLKRYRAAVLKAACVGRLVPTEAELQKTEYRGLKKNYETGEQLLARILSERRQNWQGRGKYKETAAPAADDLPSLPDGWTWASVDCLSSGERNAIVDGPFGSNLKLTDYIEPPGVPVLTTTNLRGDYSPDSVRYISKMKFIELQRSEVRGGDILMAKIGSCGLSGVYPEDMPSAIIPANLLKMTVRKEISKAYVLHYFRSKVFLAFLKEITTATAQPAFNVTKFRDLPVPLPPLAEQTRIVAEVERRLSVVEELESVVTANLQRATRLRQSILQKAFTGELTC